jgi:hypothetical protein
MARAHLRVNHKERDVVLSGEAQGLGFVPPHENHPPVGLGFRV